ncbi:methyltransferase domain-containing protein [Brevundimonas sp.]|uniref:class I SAM-dependent methyltransferase n=1 Tax=Brevundimonas sp. TaxID=1871086 RepID=UPI001D854034|nr:methyltransferase domain-containing protein [Brevundimonas sp.]MBA3999681.1 methyltransferase type 11 [Brevundimonas sp.]
MRRSVDDLKAFYGEPAGVLARRLVARRLEDAWGEAANCDVLGIGYCTPWLGAFVGARRVVAAMPGGQGAERWPSVGRNRTLLVEDRGLPFAAGTFDRVLMMHALEEADHAQALMAEAVRVMAPAGRIILAVASRGGLWARSESTPFGHGRPFSRGQVEHLLREVQLEPLAWSQTLYVPPWKLLLGMADGFEQAGRMLFPAACGLILVEASRRTYAPRKVSGGAAVPVEAALAKGVLASRPAARGARRLDGGGEPA